jgi:hypothetical protein
MENLKPVHHDIIGVYFDQDGFNEKLNLSGEYCLDIKSIKTNKKYSLTSKYSNDEIHEALDYLVKIFYLKKENNTTYCALKAAFITGSDFS